MSDIECEYCREKGHLEKNCEGKVSDTFNQLIAGINNS